MTAEHDMPYDASVSVPPTESKAQYEYYNSKIKTVLNCMANGQLDEKRYRLGKPCAPQPVPIRSPSVVKS